MSPLRGAATIYPWGMTPSAGGVILTDMNEERTSNRIRCLQPVLITLGLADSCCMSDTYSEESVKDAVRRARAESPLLTLLLDREPALAAALDQGMLPSLAAVPIDDSAMPVMRRLRLERRRLALLVAAGDLAGAYDLTAVTGALSDFADRALDTAITAAIAERTPGPRLRASRLSRWASREPRTQLFVGYRPDPDLRSGDAALPSARGAG